MLFTNHIVSIAYRDRSILPHNLYYQIRMYCKNIVHRLRRLTFAFILTIGIFTINVAISSQAIAADNYSAETDTYQETRNPNRVNTTPEELKDSKLSSTPEEEKGQSIYETVVERVNNQRDTSIKGSSNTKTKSEP